MTLTLAPSDSSLVGSYEFYASYQLGTSKIAVPFTINIKPVIVRDPLLPVHTTTCEDSIYPFYFETARF